MSVEIKRGVAIVHFNRTNKLKEVVEHTKETLPSNTKLVICDDGSDNVEILCKIANENKIPLIIGPNLGVAANKNRALWALQDCNFIAIIEDDIYPTEKGWFEIYEEASKLSEIHHFCRVQDRELEETVSEFSLFMQKNSFTPIYGPSPRGDLTFITSTVINKVGGFNPLFRGAGYAHGEWSDRVFRANLIGHPLKWIDIKEARDKFIQVGDTEGGRWNLPKEELKTQLETNAEMRKKLTESGYIYHPLVLE